MAMLWLPLTYTKNVPAAGTKRWEMTLVLKVNIVIYVTVFRNLKRVCWQPRNIKSGKIRKLGPWFPLVKSLLWVP